MAEDFCKDHEFLELRNTDYTSRTFMGGTRLSTRIGLFLLTGLAAIVAFAALFWYVDRGADRALTRYTGVTEMAVLVQRVDTDIAKLRADEKQFLLTRDTGLAEPFAHAVDGINAALEQLSGDPAVNGMQQDIATVRDGISQYDEHFRHLVQQEKALGIADGSGLSGKLRRTSAELKDRFNALNLANLADQVDRIDQQTKETLLSGYKNGVAELKDRYKALGEFLATSDLPARDSSRIGELLKSHETDTLSLINARFAMSGETQRFDELIDYVQPSMESLSAAAERRRVAAGAELRKVQLFARYTTAGGAAAILLWLILIGLVMLRSVVTPARQLAEAAGQLARGARAPAIPARGNVDSFGVIARSFDTWMDSLVDLDRVRRELDRTRQQLAQAAAAYEAEEEARAEAVRQALEDEAANAAQEKLPFEEAELPEVPLTEEAPAPAEPSPIEPGPEPEPEPAPAVAARRGFRRRDALTLRPAEGDEDVLRGGAIASISAQLQHFSQYVTAAANDVERTEGLIRGLDEASRLLDDLADAVADVRDQTNMLAFRAPEDEDTVSLAGDAADGQVARRLDAIREATTRAERTLDEVQNALDGVTDTAQVIAEQASEQALEATHKLLSQSEYLQGMLDDILGKLHPGAERSRGRTPRPDKPAGAIADLSSRRRRGPGGAG